MRKLASILAALTLMASLALPAFAAPAGVDDQNCLDFHSQAAAQAHLKADPSDPDGLDGPVGPGNGNGIACDSYIGQYPDPATDLTPVGEAAPNPAPKSGPPNKQPSNNSSNQAPVPSSMPNNGAGGMSPGHAALTAAIVAS